MIPAFSPIAKAAAIATWAETNRRSTAALLKNKKSCLYNGP